MFSFILKSLRQSHSLCRSVLVFCIVVSLGLVVGRQDVRAESLIELQKRVADNIKAVTDQARSGDSEITDFIKEKYDPKSGEEFSTDRFDEHPLREGSPEWLQAWIGEDTQAIFSDFFSCLDLRVLGPCLACGPGILIEFWWPEAAVETNDYCQGTMMDLTSPTTWGPGYAAANGGSAVTAASVSAAGCFAGNAFRDLKDELILGPLTDNLKDKQGQKADIPQGLREKPFQGQSRLIDDGGQFYEAHAYRTAFDLGVALAGGCVGECFPTPKERFPVHISEAPLVHMPMWRFPEFSVLLPAFHAGKWNDLFGALPIVALSLDISQAGTLRNAVFPGLSATIRGDFLLKTSTCSSYRAASDFHSSRGRTPITEASNFQILPGVDNEAYRRLCFPPSAGQLFPVTGYIPVTSSKTAPLGAGRRLWEIGSADQWSDLHRFNYFNDYKMKNLYRNNKGKTKSGTKDPDKWQRVFPEVSECFHTKDIDTLDNNLFPSSMGKTRLLSDTSRGEDRYIHWNRRVCCISPGCCPWREE